MVPSFLVTLAFHIPNVDNEFRNTKVMRVNSYKGTLWLVPFGSQPFPLGNIIALSSLSISYSREFHLSFVLTLTNSPHIWKVHVFLSRWPLYDRFSSVLEMEIWELLLCEWYSKAWEWVSTQGEVKRKPKRTNDTILENANHARVR